MKLFVLIFTSLFFTVSYSYSQNFEYFDTDKEVLWGINKNSWGGLLGEEESIAFAEENDIPVFLIRKKSTGEVIERYTSAMTNLFLMDPN